MPPTNVQPITQQRFGISQQRSNTPWNWAIAGSTIVVVFYSLFLLLNTSSDTTTQQQQQVQQRDDTTTTRSGTIQSGTVAGIPYYQCNGSSVSSSKSSKYHVILLHGAAFTKEDWKTSGILQDFCQQERNKFDVTALDLSVRADSDELLRVLDALITKTESETTKTKTIRALVTPSASGSTVLDAFNNNKNWEKLQSYIQYWIPVAANAINKLPNKEIDCHNWSSSSNVLAIYGDQDRSGRQSSEILEKDCNAKIVELPGKHPVYLDSPILFVHTIVDFLLLQQ